MASVLILGHGGFNQAGTQYPPEVLIPRDTTLRFFSDAGQVLMLPAKASATDPTVAVFDYDKAASVWTSFQEHNEPIPAGWVTYNFELGPQDTQEEYDLAMSIDWGGTAVSIPPGGADLILCNGTADTCPTPALRVQQAAAERGEGPAVPPERWNHACTGVLAQHAGNDIVWMSCTGFALETPELGAFATAPSQGPGTTGALWSPSDADWDRINEVNRQTIKNADNGDTMTIYAGGLLLLVGDAHGETEIDYVRRQQDLEYGDLTVTKGGTFSSGKLEITGISAKQSVVESALEQISDKTVSFG